MRQDDDDDDAASPRVARASSQSHAPISQGRARSLCCMPTLHTHTRPAHAPRPNSRSARVHGVNFFPQCTCALATHGGPAGRKIRAKIPNGATVVGPNEKKRHPHGASIEQERGDAPHQSAQPSQSQAKLSRDSQSSQFSQARRQTVLNIAWICTTPPAQRQLCSRWSKHRLGSTSPTASGWLNCCWCYCCKD